MNIHKRSLVWKPTGTFTNAYINTRCQVSTEGIVNHMHDTHMISTLRSKTSSYCKFKVYVFSTFEQ